MIKATHRVNESMPVRISQSDLENLLATLDVTVVRLSECVVSPGWRLQLTGLDAPGIHYNLSGRGRLFVGDHPPVDLHPHTLVVVPAGMNFCVEGYPGGSPSQQLKVQDNRQAHFPPGALRRHVAGESEPRLIMICGYFRATYAATIDLFSGLTAPIVEQFDARDRLDQKLKSALDELVSQEVGSGVMTTALLKQVMVALLRRSLLSVDLWAERFVVLSDPHIARAFAEMVADPASPHRVESLARTAGLSRSAFMVRFAHVFGKSPMVALRDLRIRNALLLLATKKVSREKVAAEVGYANYSSLSRAFRKAYGCDPLEYQASAAKAETLTA